MPQKQNIAPQSTTNKQGRDSNPISDSYAEEVLSVLKNDAIQCYDHYSMLLNEDDQGNILDQNRTGISREIARINLNLMLLY